MSDIGCSLFNFQTGRCTQADKDFDFLVSFSVTDSSDNPIDLTGDTFQLIIKASLGGATLLTLNEVASNLLTGLFIPSPTSGIIAIQITKADVTLISVGEFPYEMTRTDSDGKIFVFAQGVFQFFDRGF